MSKMRLSVAVGNYDRTRPLIDGRVLIDGVEPAYMTLSPEEMFFRAFRHADFDVSELSLASYVVSLGKGTNQYTALPIFLSRAFRHSSIYVTRESGIDNPAKLKGKRIGIAEYQLTANVWARALLEDDFDIRPSDVTWIRGGMDAPMRPEKLHLELPTDVQVEPVAEGETLNQLLIDCKIDGFIGPRAPRCFFDNGSNVVRLFDNSIATGLEYFSRTGIFPIMHVLGVRNTLLEDKPFLAQALIKAFTQAKYMAEAELADTSATKVTMPFVEDHLDAVKQTMGTDFWSYGIDEQNTKTLENFLDHHHRQGLSERLVGVSELFPQNALEAFSL
ncbi:MAG: ABC transporter substrate-binding protein [Candidatus Puniceispirillaceae bacterium]